MDVTSQGFWLFIFQMFQGIGQAGSVIVAFYALYLVQNYTRKKDGADFIRNRWNEQAQLNLLCIENDEALTAHEEIVYGRSLSDRKLSRNSLSYSPCSTKFNIFLSPCSTALSIRKNLRLMLCKLLDCLSVNSQRWPTSLLRGAMRRILRIPSCHCFRRRWHRNSRRLLRPRLAQPRCEILTFDWRLVDWGVRIDRRGRTRSAATLTFAGNRQ